VVSPPATLLTNRPLLGIGFMMLSATLLPAMNAFGKHLAAEYPPQQVIWARLTTHLLWMLVLFMPRSGLALFRTSRPWTQLSLSLIMLVSTTLFFFALPHVGLAKGSTIIFVSPFLVMLLAAPILGELLSWRRFLAVLAGFAGVVVVIRPSPGALDWPSLGILASSALYALFQVMARRAAAVDRPETSTLYAVLAGAIVMSAVVPLDFVAPRSLRDAAMMASMGLLGALGHYCVARALSYADAGLVSPFNYWQLAGAVVLGYAMFGDLPDAWTWTGAGIIVAAGVALAWSETAAARRRRPAGGTGPAQPH
jgi:drug/metabolite transporter (DMT)-like permease